MLLGFKGTFYWSTKLWPGSLRCFMAWFVCCRHQGKVPTQMPKSATSLVNSDESCCCCRKGAGRRAMVIDNDHIICNNNNALHQSAQNAVHDPAWQGTWSFTNRFNISCHTTHERAGEWKKYKITMARWNKTSTKTQNDAGQAGHKSPWLLEASCRWCWHEMCLQLTFQTPAGLQTMCGMMVSHGSQPMNPSYR